MPSALETLHRELGPRGLAVLAINVRESAAAVAAWAAEHRVTVPILLDVDGEVVDRYGVIATPSVFLVDRAGRLAGRAIGPRDWGSPAARALLAALLAAPAGP